MNRPPGFIELDLDISQFEETLKDLCPLFLDEIAFEELVRATALGFTFDGTRAMWTNGTPRAVFKPLDFLLNLLPALRAGELDFRTYKSILEAKVGVGDKSYHV